MASTTKTANIALTSQPLATRLSEPQASHTASGSSARELDEASLPSTVDERSTTEVLNEPALVNVALVEDVPPDGGYGWVCTACVLLMNANTWGVNAVRCFRVHEIGSSPSD